MNLLALASGSQGNSTLVRHGDAAVLVDAGLPITAMEQRLEAARLGLGAVGLLVATHGHLDHARSVGVLARRWRVPVACAPAIQTHASLRRSKRTTTLSPGAPLVVDAGGGAEPLTIHAVEIPHDAHPTYALRLDAGDRRAVILTDIGRVCERTAGALFDPHVLLLEFNHDEELLERGPYSASLKRRIRGGNGHLSNRQAADMLKRIAGPRLHTVVLAHLSRTNNTRELALAAARAALVELGRSDVDVHVAEQDSIGTPITV